MVLTDIKPVIVGSSTRQRPTAELLIDQGEGIRLCAWLVIKELMILKLVNSSGY